MKRRTFVFLNFPGCAKIELLTLDIFPSKTLKRPERFMQKTFCLLCCNTLKLNQFDFPNIICWDFLDSEQNKLTIEKWRSQLNLDFLGGERKNYHLCLLIGRPTCQFFLQFRFLLLDFFSLFFTCQQCPIAWTILFG